MGHYKFIENSSNIAADVRGLTIEDLFITAGKTWLKSAVKFFPFDKHEAKEISFAADTLEELLVSFLNELNNLLVTKKWLSFATEELKISARINHIELFAYVLGYDYSSKKVELHRKIKSVMYNQIKIEKIPEGYKTLIMFDI